ncbi:alpha/beta fold hydrolase [Bacillus solimangrovi]|uniref:Esterase n=1 Tax=Bacillus solimangrovi TaxID=1305675 RepID=A0A1E5LC26_9BACI|nr:alpha/beta fold hydrolase [Bacillus solimangrovi]OEH91648.1 esterase [Bacillus solimangrovi]
MITIVKEQPASIPTLHVVQKDKMNEQLPTVIFVHGFLSAKEHNLHYAYLLAEQGMRVLLPEALYHGERNENLTEAQLNFSFWQIVIQTIHELDKVKEVYVNKDMVEPSKIGLVGTSMGGIITLGALTQYEWVRAAVSLMGNPSYEKLARWQIGNIKRNRIPFKLDDTVIETQIQQLETYDLSKQMNKASQIPLLFWHGKLDTVVPFEHAYEFYNDLRTNYSNAITSFIVDEHTGHKVSREGVLATVDWLKRYL